MAGSSVDIQTVAQNIAQNVNSLSQTWLVLNGTLNSAGIAATAVVKNGQGRLVKISITTAGTTNGTIYDCNNTTSLLRPIFTIPNTLGIVEINFPIGYGIVVAPGTGQVVAVSYS